MSNSILFPLVLSSPLCCAYSSCSSPVPGFNNNRPFTPQLPTTVFPPNTCNLNVYEDEDQYYPEPPSLNIPLLTVTGPGNNYGPPPPPHCFSPQATRDAYQMEPDEETAAVLNQVGVVYTFCRIPCIIALLLWYASDTVRSAVFGPPLSRGCRPNAAAAAPLRRVVGVFLCSLLNVAGRRTECA